MFNITFSRMLAVTERDLRRFKRNTKLLIPMALMPIIYLVILGKSMGGDLHDLPLALVVQDHGMGADAVRERVLLLARSRELFRIRSEPDPSTAVRRLREGQYKGVVIVPPGFSENLSRGEQAPIGLVVDNTDNTSASVIEAELRRALTVGSATVQSAGGSGATSSATAPSPTAQAGVDVQRVDVYGHKEFMQYLVPGVIALALFFVAMLAGGIILVDDRARGIHEGYFVTPLSALDLVGGFTLSAVTLATFIGTLVLVSSILIARLPILRRDPDPASDRAHHPAPGPGADPLHVHPHGAGQ